MVTTKLRGSSLRARAECLVVMAARANSSRTGLATLVRRAIHPAMRPVHADVAVASLVTHRPATSSHHEESTRRRAVGWATERRSSRGFAAATAAMSKEGGDSPRQFDPDDILAPLRDKVERDMAGLTEQTPQQAALERERARREEIAETFEDEDGKNRVTGEWNGPRGPEPTRFGDWEQAGRCSDF